MSDGKRLRDDETRRGGESNLSAASQRQGASSSLRVFCALELPAEVRQHAANHSARLRTLAPDVRASWDRVEKLHITLKFIGEISRERVVALSDAASRAALHSTPFILALSGRGAFPARGNPRVLWLGIEDSAGALINLHSRLEEECAIAGFSREERSFHPHLTLARIRAPRGARELAELHRQTDFERIEFSVADLVVMRSQLGPGGSRYTEISRHGLNS